MDAVKNEATIRLMIVDDQPLIRRGLAMMLDTEPDIDIVATAEDGQKAIEMALETEPDVIVMDLQMPGINGVDATREITNQLPDTRIVVLTTFDHDGLVFDAIRAGAQAYLLKDATETEVLATIKAVHQGESYLSPSIARKVMGQFRNLPDTSDKQPNALASEIPSQTKVTNQTASPATESGAASLNTEIPLTAKEEQILSQIAEGKTNKQIAEEIHLAEGTVKNYVSRIMAKLHAQSRTELAVRAVSRQHSKTTQHEKPSGKA